MKRSLLKRFNFLNLPIVLFILWMLLQESWTVGQVLLGLFLSIAISIAAWPFRPIRATMQHPWIALRLILHVSVDITKSNYDVGLIVWRGKKAKATPGFLEIPLRIRDPHGLAALACIITYTPGTVWAGYIEESNLLTLHILDLKDEQLWLDVIQKRYQEPLIEIFE